jgi:hypothetical protein
MSNLLTDPEIDFKTGLAIWVLGTMLFWLALWVATSIATVKLSFGALSLIAVTCSLVSLIPFVGQILCFVVAAFLLYRMTDLELGQAVLTAVLTRAVVLILLVGVYSYASNQREHETVEQQIQRLKHGSQ